MKSALFTFFAKGAYLADALDETPATSDIFENA